MKTIKIYTEAWQILLRSFKLSTFIYLFFLLAALLLAIPFYRLLVNMGGNSMLPDSILTRPDLSNLIELLRDGGKSLRFFISALWPWMLLFFLLNTLFQGGILSWISDTKRKFQVREFISSSMHWFWPFFRVAIYFLVWQLIVGIICYLPAILLTTGDGVSDQFAVRTFVISGIIHLFVLSLFTVMADMTRFMIFESGNRKVFRWMWKSMGLVLRKIPSVVFVFVFWFIIPLALIEGYWFIKTNIIVDTSVLILLVFVLQQLFIWIRYNLRVQRIGMFYRYYLTRKVTN